MIGYEYQTDAGRWARECFGADCASDLAERARRFVEEALELAQAVGMGADEAKKLVDYVFSRPEGDIPQEVGGVGVTLAVLCHAMGVNMPYAFTEELRRVQDPQTMERIKAKQLMKREAGVGYGGVA